MAYDISFSVFTKPWPKLSLDNLSVLVKNMGFDSIEFPLRQGFQITPEDGSQGLLRLQKILAEHKLSISSIAPDVSSVIPDKDVKTNRNHEEIFAGCAEADIKIIRICQEYDKALGFHDNISQIKKRYDTILPLCEKYNVSIGVQMHCGWNVFSAAELYILIKDYDPKHISAVWDAGHNGLTGTEPEISLDTLWNNLSMINFKSAFFEKTGTSASGEFKWAEHWTTGKLGMGQWKKAVDYIKKRGYSGSICLCSEYTDEENTEIYIREDINYIKELF